MCMVAGLAGHLNTPPQHISQLGSHVHGGRPGWPLAYTTSAHFTIWVPCAWWPSWTATCIHHLSTFHNLGPMCMVAVLDGHLHTPPQHISQLGSHVHGGRPGRPFHKHKKIPQKIQPYDPTVAA